MAASGKSPDPFNSVYGHIQIKKEIHSREQIHQGSAHEKQTSEIRGQKNRCETCGCQVEQRQDHGCQENDNASQKARQETDQVRVW